MTEKIIADLRKKRYSEKLEIPQPDSPLLIERRSDSHPNLHHPIEPKGDKVIFYKIFF